MLLGARTQAKYQGATYTTNAHMCTLRTGCEQMTDMHAHVPSDFLLHTLKWLTNIACLVSGCLITILLVHWCYLLRTNCLDLLLVYWDS